jgi:protein disulfide-isomerase A6
MFYNLTEDNKKDINNILNKEENVVVLYYMTYCGHCIELKPDWDKICVINKNSKDVIIVNVEADVLKYLNLKYRKNIVGFPTIIKYNKGIFVKEYDGIRKLSNLKTFIKK